MKTAFINAAVIGSLLITGCTGQPGEKPPTTPTPPVVTPPVTTPPTTSRVKIRSLVFKDAAVAYQMQVITAGNPDMYADQVNSLVLEQVTDLTWLKHFTQLKALIVSGQVKDTVDLSSNTLLETLDIKADSLLLSKNNRLSELTAEVGHIEFPSAAQLTQLHLTHRSIMGPHTKELYRTTQNPILANYLKLDLGNQAKLQQAILSGQFAEVILPSNGVLENLTLKGSATATLTGLAKQSALKLLDVVLDKNIQALNVSALAQLEYLAVKADGLLRLDISALTKLDVLEVASENLSQINSNKLQGALHHMRLMAPKINSLDLNPYQNLYSFYYAGGALDSLDAPLEQLTNITIGTAPLRILRIGNCRALVSLEVGYNQLEQLDLRKCSALTSASVLPSSLKTQDVLTTQLKLPQGVERTLPVEAKMRISDLSNQQIPDARLLSCVQAAGKAENALYVQQLKNLSCRGEDSKAYYQSFASLQEGRVDPLIKDYIFDVTGLSLLTGLESLDLGVNWISQINVDSLYKLKRLTLDGNIIQDANFTRAGSLRQLELGSNPLSHVALPDGLEQFNASAGITSNSYVAYVLGKYGLDILRNGPEGKLLSSDNFSQKIAGIGLPASLTDIQSNRLAWPPVPAPGSQRLRFADLNIEDKNLKACIKNDFTYADEVRTIYCPVRSGGGEYVIRSFKGLEQLNNLEEMSLYGLDLRSVDFSELKHLKKLTIGDSRIDGLAFWKIPGLEEVAVSQFGLISSATLTLDFSQNTHLRRMNLSGIGQVMLPESDSLEFFSLRMNLNAISTDNKYPDLDLSRYSHLYKLDIDNRIGNLTLPENSVLDSFGCMRCKPQKLVNLEKQQRLVNLSLSLPAETTQLNLSDFSRLYSLNLDSETLQALKLENNARLDRLVLNAPRLTQLSAPALSGLTRLDVTAPKLAQLDSAVMPNLVDLKVSDPGFKQLDLSTLSNLEHLFLGDGALQALTLGANTRLEDIFIGSSKIQALDFSQLSALKNLHLGRSQLQVLDVQSNQALMSLTYTLPAPADIRLPEVGFELPVTVEPAVKKIQALTSADLPDEILRKCVTATAISQGIEYVDELTDLSCRGGDGKERERAMSTYSKGQSFTGLSCCIFNLKGLKQFYNLRSLDLTGNWISTILADDINLPKLLSLNLDHNAIQTLSIPNGRDLPGNFVANPLRNLSLNANPLSQLLLPGELHYLSATEGDDWIYTDITLRQQFKTEPMLDWLTRSPLTLNEYKRQFSVQYLGEVLFINSNKFAR